MANVAFAAVLLAVGNLASRALGLVREQVIAALFGASTGTDAFVVASSVPQVVYDLLIGGAVSAALVPTFVRTLDREAALRGLVRSLLTLALLALVVVGAVLALASPLLVDALAPGFGEEQRQMAITMVRLMLLAVVLQGLAGVVSAVLFARRRFGLAAFSAAVYNLGIIVGALALHERLGIFALVAGVLAGAAGQLAIQVPRAGIGPWPFTAHWWHPELPALVWLYLPVAAGIVVSIIGVVIDRNLASRLPEGSLSVMNYATRVIQFPIGLVATALSMAVLPELSQQAHGREQSTSVDGDHDGFRDTLTQGVRIALLLMLPAALISAALREPLLRVLYERGQFVSGDTSRTALAFLAYAPQLPFVAIDQLLIAAYYARRDTRTPVLVGVVCVGLYVVVALSVVQPLGVPGLALANTVQNSAHGVILWILLQRSGWGVRSEELRWFVPRVSLAAAVSAAVAALVSNADVLPQVEVVLLGAAFLAGALCYVGALEGLGIRDVRVLALGVLRRAGAATTV
ncbi:MAG: murein biosynthesis integral membrane protein MurJ [Chloroflexota bacterium]